MKTALIIALSATAIGVAAQAPSDPLEAAKSLYVAASYQEALAALDGVKDADADDAVKYRVLCLLGLNRVADAEQTLDQLLIRHPLFKADAVDSPKLQAMVHDARARVLPTAATTLYATAKAAFDKGDLTTAAKEFATVTTLLDQPEVTSQPAIADLKVLAGGFAKLTDQELLLEQRAAAAKAAASTPPPAPAPTVPAVVDRIYTEADAGVTPPVTIAEVVPPWVPPNTVLRSLTYMGVLDIVIDEHGAVSSARIARPTVPIYDQLLLGATKQWRYRPASVDGRAVKYRKTVQVILRPPPGTAPGATLTP